MAVHLIEYLQQDSRHQDPYKVYWQLNLCPMAAGHRLRRGIILGHL